MAMERGRQSGLGGAAADPPLARRYPVGVGGGAGGEHG